MFSPIILVACGALLLYFVLDNVPASKSSMELRQG